MLVSDRGEDYLRMNVKETKTPYKMYVVLYFINPLHKCTKEILQCRCTSVCKTQDIPAS